VDGKGRVMELGVKEQGGEGGLSLGNGVVRAGWESEAG